MQTTSAARQGHKGSSIELKERGGEMRENEIPQEGRNYFLDGREDVFEKDGKYYLFMGKWAGWQIAEKIFVYPNGSISALSGKLDEKAAVEAAAKILKERKFCA